MSGRQTLGYCHTLLGLCRFIIILKGTFQQNSTLPWNADTIYFTSCYPNILLALLHCLFLWTFTPLELYYIRASRRRNIPWGWRIISKLAVTSAVILLAAMNLYEIIKDNADGAENYALSYFIASFQIATFIWTAVLVHLNRVVGLRTSGLLSLFWLFSLFLGIPQYHTQLFREFYERSDEQQQQMPFIVYMVYLPLTAMMVVLYSIADEAPEGCEYAKDRRPSPEHSSSFFSRLFFVWFDPTTWKGSSCPITEKDLFDLPWEETCSEVGALFDKHWSETQERAQISDESATRKKVSTLPAIFKLLGPAFMFTALMGFAGDMLAFLYTNIVVMLLVYTQSSEPLWKGFLCALGLFMVSVTQSLLRAQCSLRMSRVGGRVHSAVTAAIYRKSLAISNSARDSIVLEVEHLVDVDAQRLLHLFDYVTVLWSAPVQIVVALCFLFDAIGIGVISGLGAVMFSIPISGFIAANLKVLQRQRSKDKSERVKIMNEILRGIKVFKLYAWEKPLAKKILGLRQRELDKLKKGAFWQAVTSVSNSFAPYLMTMVSFLSYVMSNPERNILSPVKAFVTICLFNIMYIPLASVSAAMRSFFQARASLRRIDKFMNYDDLNPSNVSHNTSKGVIRLSPQQQVNPLYIFVIVLEVAHALCLDTPIVIEGGSFAWRCAGGPAGRSGAVLSGVSLRVQRGQLVALVGGAGSGKSSLLAAILGEMEIQSGSVITQGSFAYVPQQAWIQNATVKDNITFGKPLDSNLYASVLCASAVQADLDSLGLGDDMLLGEGVGLSEGQKQRVSIARAVYSDSDVYLFDDTLRTMERDTAKHVFKHIIGPNGLLRNKTRVLVTNCIWCLRNADIVVVLKDGEVQETGSYAEVLRRQGAFAEFLLRLLKKSAQDLDMDELTVLSAELKGSVAAGELQRQGSVSEGRSPRRSLRRKASQYSSASGSTTSRRSESQSTLIHSKSVEKGSVNFKAYHTLLQSLSIPTALATVLLFMIYEGLAVGTNLWFAKWTSDSDCNNASSPLFNSKQNGYLKVTFVMGVLQGFMSVAAAFAVFLFCGFVSRDLHQSMVQRILRCPMSFFDTTPTETIMNWFTKDMDIVDDVLPDLLHRELWMIITAIGLILTISYGYPLFLIVVPPIGALYFAVHRFYVPSLRQFVRLEIASRAAIRTQFRDSISGAACIRAFGQSGRFVGDIYRRLDAYKTCYFSVTIANCWAGVRLDLAGAVATFFAALFAVLRRGSTSPGMVGVAITCALQIIQCFHNLVKLSVDLETNVVSVERLEYAETSQESEWDSADHRVEESWPKEGKVEFKNYQFRYREGLPLVLKGIDLVVNGGEKVGVVGRPGAGKSSLALGLFRVAEAAGGQILIDGVDISKLGLHTLRSRLTLIPRDPLLVSGPLRMSLDPLGKLPDGLLWRVLDRVHLRDLVESLPAGLDHPVTQGGADLSVGQRQLVNLARALLWKRRILVLDKATAAVDPDTDILIQEIVSTCFKGSTVFTVSPKFDNIMEFDKVLLVDRGRVKEYDSPQVLLQTRNSMFYSLAEEAGLV